MLEPRHLIRFPIKTATHTDRGEYTVSKQSTCASPAQARVLSHSLSLSLPPFSHIPLPHTRLKCRIVVCLVLLLCAVQKKTFLIKILNLHMLLPDAGNALANSRGNSPLSLSLCPPLRPDVFGVAFGYLWQELLLPPEVVTSREQRQEQGEAACGAAAGG